MIAVFTKHVRGFLSLDVSPEESFKCITGVWDIEGISFTSAIHIHNWHENLDAVEAHKELKTRQPEIFKDVRGTYY